MLMDVMSTEVTTTPEQARISSGYAPGTPPPSNLGVGTVIGLLSVGALLMVLVSAKTRPAGRPS